MVEWIIPHWNRHEECHFWTFLNIKSKISTLSTIFFPIKKKTSSLRLVFFLCEAFKKVVFKSHMMGYYSSDHPPTVWGRTGQLGTRLEWLGLESHKFVFSCVCLCLSMSLPLLLIFDINLLMLKKFIILLKLFFNCELMCISFAVFLLEQKGGVLGSLVCSNVNRSIAHQCVCGNGEWCSRQVGCICYHAPQNRFLWQALLML